MPSTICMSLSMITDIHTRKNLIGGRSRIRCPGICYASVDMVINFCLVPYVIYLTKDLIFLHLFESMVSFSFLWSRIVLFFFKCE